MTTGDTTTAPVGMPGAHPDARTMLADMLDPGSFTSWDAPVVEAPADAEYALALAEARRRTGVDEAVLTGEGLIRGRRVAVLVGEFAFLGGTIGVAAAERLTQAIERATRERLPLLAAPVSGGTRMQEGTVAFLQMVKIVQAVMRHRAAGLPYLVYLRSPTTGGVFASWGSLGHVTGAEPGALIGFLGPRVYKALYGEPFPAGVQLAENLYQLGLLDAVVPPEHVPETAARALDVLCAPAGEVPIPDAPPVEPIEDLPAWESIRRTRRPERPGVRDLLRQTAHSITVLSGTQQGEREPTVLVALAKFGVAPCVLLGQDRPSSTRTPLGPGGLRAARRGLRLASELGLPVLTVIDTAGAALSRDAEERGLAGEIARSLADLVTLPVPTLCLLLGQGAGGGALALLPTDRVVAAQHAWLAPLPPEGASEILYRTVDRTAEIAAAQGVRSIDLSAAGIVDHIVAEHPDAADESAAFLARLGAVLEYELASLLRRDAVERMRSRHERFRRLGLSPQI